MEGEEYRKAFRDIVRGYSSAFLDSKRVYIKHLSTHDQVDYNDVYEDHYERAKGRGLPTEKDSLSFQTDEGFWTPEDDRFIEEQQSYIRAMRDNKKALFLKSAIDSHNRNIEKAEESLQKKLTEKTSLVGNCCETYASARANDHYIINSYFLNTECSSPLLTESTAEELTYSEMTNLIRLFNDTTAYLSEQKIQELVLQDFFYIYFPFSGDTVGFYGKPIVELSDNQLKLIVYTKIFKNIFEKNAQIPEKIRKDPSALLDFGNVDDASKAKIKADMEGLAGGGSTLVGATTEDLEYLGIEKSRGKSIHQAAIEKGGSLSMEDLMKLHNT